MSGEAESGDGRSFQGQGKGDEDYKRAWPQCLKHPTARTFWLCRIKDTKAESPGDTLEAIRQAVYSYEKEVTKHSYQVKDQTFKRVLTSRVVQGGCS